MKVHLYKFRSFERETFSFNEKEVNLLSGDSGKGKTTILEAIRWCLFSGSGKSVFPFGTTSKSSDPTSVEINFDEGEVKSIKRSVPPDKLTLILKNKKEYSSSDAQRIIFSIFGKEELFGCTSYIPQNERNLLLSVNNASKMELFEKLIFDDDDSPDAYISKIDEILRCNRRDFEKNIIRRNELLEIIKSKSGEIEILDEDFEILDSNFEEEILPLKNELKIEEYSLSQMKNTLRERNFILFEIKKIDDELSLLNEEGEGKLEDLFLEEKKLRDDFVETIKIEEKNRILSKNIASLPPFDYSLADVIRKIEDFPFEEFKEYFLLSEFFKKEILTCEDENDISSLLSEKKRISSILELLPVQFSERMLLFDYSASYEKLKYYFANYPKEIFQIPENEEDLLSKKEDLLKLMHFQTSTLSFIEKGVKAKLLERGEDPPTKILLLKNKIDAFSKKEELISLEESLVLLKKRENDLFNEEGRVREEYFSLQGKYHLPPIEFFDENGTTTQNIYECPSCKEKLTLGKEGLQKVNLLFISDKDFVLIKKLKKRIREIHSLTSSIKMEIKVLEEKINCFPSEIRECDSLSPEEKRRILLLLKEIPPSLEEGMKVINRNLKEEVGNVEEKIQMKKIFSLHQYFSFLDKEDLSKLILLTSEKKFSIEKKKYQDLIFFGWKGEDSQSLKEKIVSINQKIEKRERIEKKKSLLLSFPFFEKINPASAEEISSIEKYLDFSKQMTPTSLSSEKILEREKKVSSLIKKLSLLQKRGELSSSLGDEINEEEVFLLQEKVEKMEEKLGTSLRLLPLKKKIDEVLSLKSEEEEISLLLSEKEKKIEGMEELKKIIVALRGEILSTFISSIQNITNKILKCIFEDEIQFIIKLTKTASQKVEGRSVERSLINFEIKYKSLSFDSVSFLSGGEKDRISLALSIAMAICVNSKVLILDESLSSLDEGMRDVCVKELKNYTEGRTIINVCHSVTEGYHDNIVEI